MRLSQKYLLRNAENNETKYYVKLSQQYLLKEYRKYEDEIIHEVVTTIFIKRMQKTTRKNST